METKAQEKSHSFGWLNATQFFGALNDNVFKLLIVYFLIAAKGKAAAGSALATSGIILAVPFLLFSAAAGVLADRQSKRTIIVWAKCAEVAAMVLGCAAFLLGTEIGLYVILFLMATQSAFFGPSKYGIVPELVGKDRLSQANGLLQVWLDGQLVLDVRNLTLRHNRIGLDGTTLSFHEMAIGPWYHGGIYSQQPMYVWMDEIAVSTQRIGLGTP